MDESDLRAQLGDLFRPQLLAVLVTQGPDGPYASLVARKYGIPCVTGVPGATEQIRTGDWLTVDGTLGIVTIERRG